MDAVNRRIASHSISLILITSLTGLNSYSASVIYAPAATARAAVPVYAGINSFRDSAVVV